MADPTDREAHVFSVETHFQRMARRPGGVPRERALEGAQRHIDELKPEFTGWLDRELQELAALVQQMANNPGDASLLERVYQACRQLRDVGATMEFELITFIADNFCDILDAIKAGAAFEKAMIDCHMDALLLARTEPYRKLRPEQLPEMTSGLRRMVELASVGTAREGT